MNVNRSTPDNVEPDVTKTDGELSLPPRPQTLRFDSRGEYACGALMERYIPSFTLQTGTTFQVPVGFGKLIDFRVHGVFVEYHPTSIHHEFDNRAALRQLLDTCKRLKEYQRAQIIAAVRDELHEKYCRRRKFLLTATIGKEAELIVVRSPEDFYANVIKRFGLAYPSYKEFRREFNRLLDGKIP